MSESIKAICGLFIIVAGIVALFVWTDDRPDQTTWILRGSTIVVTALSLAVILRLHFRRDLARDYLQEITGGYFNRDGFCFVFGAEAVDGVCQFHAYYQNQYERPFVGRIALRPARGFFLTRAKIDTITFEIACDAAAYGVATLPIPLPREIQGKPQSFEVGASVNYPQGKGKRLRFRDGVFLRTNTNFGNSFGTALKVAGALGGAIVLSSPATATVLLPTDVAEELPSNSESNTTQIWKLGDPPVM
ncbi:MAG: GTP-binding protein LepA [Planctomycetaceae bacterium]|nr:GTP-binding protein LepA [Planctomycetaceae bacterium]